MVKAAWMLKFARQRLPEDVRPDLLQWSETLKTFKNYPLIPALNPREVHWVGDASTSYGIAAIIGNKWCQFRLKEGWQTKSDVKRGIAWLKTVSIRLGILMIAKMNWKGGQRFNVWTDNTTCEEALKKHRSRDGSVNNKWKAIQNLLVMFQYDINPLRVESQDNAADALSQGIRTGHDEVNRIRFDLPIDLVEFIEESPMLDSRTGS